MFKIISGDGEKNLEIPDGIYDVTAKITIQDGKIVSIDKGIWKLEQV